jgi:hypothetical protein
MQDAARRFQACFEAPWDEAVILLLPDACIRSLDRVGTRGRRPRRCPPTRWSMANETEWAERVRQAEASGLSIPAFAAKHRLSKSALYNWRRRLATQAAGSAEASSSPSALRARIRSLNHVAT